MLTDMVVLLGKYPSLPKPKWHWQLSLRTLLVLLAAFCLGLTLLIVPAERQRQAAATVRDLGGRVTFP